MAGINKVILIGRLGKEPEIKQTNSGVSVANFSVATSDKWTDKSGTKQEKTEWHNVVVFDKLAKLVQQYVHKGSNVYLEGKLQTRSWDNKQGVKQYTTEIIANQVQFLDAKKDNSQQTNEKVSNEQSYYNSNLSEMEDIPF